MWYKYLIYFIIFFIIIYLIYYVLFVRKRLKYSKKRLSADLQILEGYYKIDIKKIGYQRVLKILNFVNSLMLTLLVMVVINIDKVVYKLLILCILMVPTIWVVYYFLAKYLKYIEGKMK
ncbi:MAG: hypothetical protein IJ105_05375 [Bacilli bacterium]|nr:hypothetical protein [Bacilli bacterium]